jgi:hypothetical protein
MMERTMQAPASNDFTLLPLRGVASLGGKIKSWDDGMSLSHDPLIPISTTCFYIISIILLAYG